MLLGVLDIVGAVMGVVNIVILLDIIVVNDEKETLSGKYHSSKMKGNISRKRGLKGVKGLSSIMSSSKGSLPSTRLSASDVLVYSGVGFIYCGTNGI